MDLSASLKSNSTAALSSSASQIATFSNFAEYETILSE